MKLILKNPERFLLALGLVLMSAIILVSFLVPFFSQKADVVYVSEEEYQKLSLQSDITSVILNIDTATAEELTAISGVGTALAEKIVSYRQEHGSFSSVDELINIEGIGEQTLKKIAPYVTVD